MYFFFTNVIILYTLTCAIIVYRSGEWRGGGVREEEGKKKECGR